MMILEMVIEKLVKKNFLSIKFWYDCCGVNIKICGVF